MQVRKVNKKKEKGKKKEMGKEREKGKGDGAACGIGTKLY